MARRRLDYGIIAVIVFAAVIAVLLIALLFVYFRTGELNEASAPQPSATPDTALATEEDFSPDTDRLFTSVDGTLLDADGREYALKAFSGQPLALYFWSSWCEDCQAMTDKLTGIADAVELAGGRFIMVCRLHVRGETVESARAYLAENNLSFECFYDNDGALYEAIGFHEVPSMAFLDANGTLTSLKSGSMEADEAASRVRYAMGEGHAQTFEFMNRNLMTKGGVSAHYVINEDGTVSASDLYLSETQGLMMMYAVETDDQKLFDELLNFTNANLTKDGLTAWQMEDGMAASVNATLDDLRILRTLMAAQERWGGYRAQIETRSGALYKKTVIDGQLVDYAALDGDGHAQTLALCYADLLTLDALAKEDESWRAVLENARSIVLNGYISDDFPLYYPSYSYETGRYSNAQIHTAEALTTILHLAEADAVKKTTLDYLERLVTDGAVYARYTTDGETVSGYDYESTAVYALLARIGQISGRDEMMKNAMRQMEKHRQWTGDSRDGGYSGLGEVYTFDTAQALLTLKALDGDE